MTVVDSLFLFFSLALVLSAGLVVLGRNPVVSALCLVLVFLFTAGLYILLQAFFLALLQVLVYAGAIMVLFLFVVMLNDVRPGVLGRTVRLIAGIGALAVSGVFCFSVGVVLKRSAWVGGFDATRFRGELAAVITPLFSRYLLPTELVGLILLAATIGVVVLTRKEEPS